ncbi:MAG: methyltransferase domain-containing protein [Erythrobacter sp.]|nr:methyltransferase domain-containing protein [Erythrobacter sp.]
MELAALFLRECGNCGPICDVGAGEGAAALALACLVERDVVAIEVVEERVDRIARRAERHGLSNLTAVAADARTVPLGDFAGFYLFSPFFDDDADVFLERMAKECRSGTRVVGKGMIAKRMRAQPALRECGEDRGWGWCTAKLA